MKYDISEELFEEVMDIKFVENIRIDADYDEYNGIEITDWYIIKYNNIWIPLDTFFFKCKEWALGQGYKIQSGIYTINQGKDKDWYEDESNFPCLLYHSIKKEVVIGKKYNIADMTISLANYDARVSHLRPATEEEVLALLLEEK